VLYGMLVVVCKALKLGFVDSTANVIIQSWETNRMPDEILVETMDNLCFVLYLCHQVL
jgi:hypothetical protein